MVKYCSVQFLYGFAVAASIMVYIVTNYKTKLKMKKLNPFLFAAILLAPFSAGAQTFPLLNNVYSSNCSDMAVRSSYWQKNSDGEVVRFGPQLKENKFTYTKETVLKYSVDGNKVSSELIDALNQNKNFETLELKPDGKAFRLFNYSSAGEEIVKNGKLVSDERRQTVFESLCDPNSEITIYVKSQLQPTTNKAEAPASKKPSPDASVNSQQSGSEGTAEALCAAVMYFAIGESTGQTKEQYIKMGRAFLMAGAKLAGETKLVEMYERHKKIVNSFTDKDFKSMTNSCTEMAPK
jgi:hypothetical protein